MERIRETNKREYGTEHGRSSLRVIDLSFEERWIYLFELVQNAIDARARRLSISVKRDILVFQHDGTQPITEKGVNGFSSLFASTKGLDTVGFMGIGFKSVFRRFRQVGVRGFGWSFRYDITIDVGNLVHDEQPDLIGAVLPEWDDTIDVPEEGYTTLFHLSRSIGGQRALKEDIEQVFPATEPTVLAILAHNGILEMRLGESVWRFSEHSEDRRSVEVTALRGDTKLRWRLFPCAYVPSDSAIRRLAERRRVPIRTRLDLQRARKQRTVLGIIALDEDGKPSPPRGGRIFATLPTSATIPIGIHIHADWIVNISRTGLPELDDNEWQQEIIDRIPEVLDTYVGWLRSFKDDRGALRSGLGALRPIDEQPSTSLTKRMASDPWRKALARLLSRRAILPGLVKQGLRLHRAADIGLAPTTLSDAFSNRAEMHPEVLFRGPIVVRDMVPADTLAFFQWLGLLNVFGPQWLRRRWPGGLKEWSAIMEDEPAKRRDALIALWASLSQLAAANPRWRELPSVPSITGKWLPPAEVTFLVEPLPSSRETLGTEVLELLRPYLPPPSKRPEAGLFEYTRSMDYRDPLISVKRVAWGWLEPLSRQARLADVVKAAFESDVPQATPTQVINLAQWARNRNRTDLVPKVIVDGAMGRELADPSTALVAEPYVEHGDIRRQLLSALAVISTEYLSTDPFEGDAVSWRNFLESLGAQGPFRIKEVTRTVGRYEDAEVLRFLKGGVSVEPANNSGYTLHDRVISYGRLLESLQLVAPLLEREFSALRQKGHRYATSFYSTARHMPAVPGTATWVQELQRSAWVPCTDTLLRRPSEALLAADPVREDAPVASLTSALGEALIAEGLQFGREVPAASELLRLARFGSTLGVQDFTSSLGAALQICAQFHGGLDQLRMTLQAVTWPRPVGDGRVSFSQLARYVGSRHRSSLNDWVVGVTDYPPELHSLVLGSQLSLSIPETTSAVQALSFLQAVWRRASEGEARLANEVRQTVPLAYAYVLEGLTGGELTDSTWHAVVDDAYVFGGRRWAKVRGSPPPILDDLGEPELRDLLPVDVILATPGQLGADGESQLRVAQRLGLPLLSDILHPEWIHGNPSPHPGWAARFNALCHILGAARSEPEAAGTKIRLVPLASLSVRVGTNLHKVCAKREGFELAVAGEPDEFASSVAEMLVDFYGVTGSQTATQVAMALVLLDRVERFTSVLKRIASTESPEANVDELLNGLAGPTQALNTPEGEPSTYHGENEYGGEAGGALDVINKPPGELATMEPEDEQVPRDGADTSAHPSGSDPAVGTPPNVSVRHDIDGPQNGSPNVPGQSEPESLTPGEPHKDNASGKERPSTHIERGTMQRRRVVTYLSAPGHTSEPADLQDPSDDESPENIRIGKAAEDAVELDERSIGRRVTRMTHHNPGFDIISEDSSGGDRRYIEVKGLIASWGPAGVPLSARQFRHAWEERTAFWLYVVEHALDPDRRTITRIQDPVSQATQYRIDEGWRLFAED